MKIGVDLEVCQRFQDLITARISVLFIAAKMMGITSTNAVQQAHMALHAWTYIACRFLFIRKDYLGVCQKWDKSNISWSIYELFSFVVSIRTFRMTLVHFT